MNLRKQLETRKIMTDGSFGTYYADKYATQEMPELANLLHPERVTEIHREYLEAGAQLLRTNTFASDSVLLSEDEAEVERNLKAAVANAREAIRQAGCVEAEDSERWTADAGSPREVYIAGDIGPIPAAGFLAPEAIEEEYVRLASLLAGERIPVLLFETFPELDPLVPAIKQAKAEHPDLFVIVQFAINQYGYSSAGLSVKKLLGDAAKIAGIDAIGLNCGIGPGHMCQILEKMDLPAGKWLTTLPNAGYPKLTRNQLQFGNTPDYFASKMQDLAALGSSIIGGCCGTNPVFMKKLHDSVDFTQQIPPIPVKKAEEGPKPVKKQGFLYDEHGNLKQKKLIAVELAPPFDANDERLMESAHFLMNMGVDVLTFPDSPSGRTRVDPVLMAGKVHRETGMTVMPHICCRDKNAIAMRSLFLGADINDIHNALIITGDPLPSMARQTVKAVFNFDSTGLMSIVKEMNEDTFANHPFCYGGAINQGRKNLSAEIGRVKKKMDCGAEFFLTQPVFSDEDVSRLRRIKEETGARILCGIMPLVSRKNALFMMNEITGVNVTEEVLARYPEHAAREEGEAAGVALAKEMMEKTADFADGYYFTFPFNRVYLLEQIM